MHFTILLLVIRVFITVITNLLKVTKLIVYFLVTICIRHQIDNKMHLLIL